MKRYFLTNEDEQTAKNSGINPDFINAISEVAYNEVYYAKEENLPDILKQFIEIAKSKGLELKIKYGLQNNCAGFLLKIDGKAQFIEDYLIEDESKHDIGLKWFRDSLQTTFIK